MRAPTDEPRWPEAREILNPGRRWLGYSLELNEDIWSPPDRGFDPHYVGVSSPTGGAGVFNLHYYPTNPLELPSMTTSMPKLWVRE